MIVQPLAIVPCRLGSTGVPFKNIRLLNGISPVVRAAQVARAAGCRVVVTSEANISEQLEWGCNADAYHRRPAELAQDDSPMIDVVRDALASERGDPGDLVVLIQCTQPLRKPAHVTQAIELLEHSGADSVVSVVELPAAFSPELACELSDDGRLWPWPQPQNMFLPVCWAGIPSRRQDTRFAYVRDGTVYAFRRSTVTTYGTIYGQDVRPLIIDPAETCPLDTEADWREAEWRLRETLASRA